MTPAPEQVDCIDNGLLIASNDKNMLKRQRPATPPPPSLDLPSYFFDRPIKSLPHRSVDATSISHEPRNKRQRIHPPVLDGALRGWAASDPTSCHEQESDGEEDWVDEADDVAERHEESSLATTTDLTEQYKQTNSLLHELHTHHQHRLTSAQCIPHKHLDQPPLWREYPGPALDEVEVQSVRERYEDANRFLASLFLSRRRELGAFSSATDDILHSYPR